MVGSSIGSLPAGAELAAALAAVDIADLDADQTLTWLAGWQRLAGWVEGQSLQAIAHFADLRGGDQLEDLRPGRERRIPLGGQGTPAVGEFAADEIAAELGLSTRRASGLISDALDLRHRLPGVLAALSAGRVEAWRAHLVARGTRELSRAQAADVEVELLPELASVTTSRVRKLVEAACIAADPEGADQRVEVAARGRFVARDRSIDGSSDLFARLETADAIRLDARIDQVADLMRELGDTRVKAELRAVALGLLADPGAVQQLWRQVCAHRAGRPAEAQAVGPVPATTLYVHHSLGAKGEPQWRLEDSGPITRREALDLLGHSHVTIKPVIDLRETVTCTGYQASAGLREVMVLLNPTCYFPYCDRSSRKGEYEHVVPHPRGPTSSINGAMPDRHHHRTKTHASWVVRQPFPGLYVWRSPTGRIYVVDQRGHTTRINAP
jgi:Domain of unknown function (DUF222)